MLDFYHFKKWKTDMLALIRQNKKSYPEDLQTEMNTGNVVQSKRRGKKEKKKEILSQHLTSSNFMKFCVSSSPLTSGLKAASIS